MTHIENHDAVDAHSFQFKPYGRKRVVPDRFQYPGLHMLYLELEQAIGIASHRPSAYDLACKYLRRGKWSFVGALLAEYARAFQVEDPWKEFDLVAIHARGNAALRAIAAGYLNEATSQRDEEEDLCCGGPHALRQVARRRAVVARMLRWLRAKRGEYKQMVTHWSQIGF
ncbi:hypothetical protein KTE60_31375 [Burkholderia multivorans]|uniref:hypothetical protein n=1 Tax=Burkholderia multivorans TaxID=87883 RepID=UPI0019D0E4D8|nr:hypothetical protein [Burkholderia multivorans]MBN6738872.1 hypothetical protein [Burkholderia multivorans]MBN7130353.1 hypothetical protein [Burkholderia multivorans]MBN8173346.1 hypothetical protein [Burkholderia multivorans]MBU9439749.1 hypothetical protein [Burkholderia multivorans]MBU9576510.1 hypothetical protein [Burkholderia multivorans]